MQTERPHTLGAHPSGPPPRTARDDRLSDENRPLPRRVRELEAQACIDPLTALLNRRAVHDAFEREAARARRSHETLCVALLDIDDLQAFNDTHGHTAGDELLLQSAQAWRRALRLEDQLARVGGDEFAALLSRASVAEAGAIVARLAGLTPHGQSVSSGVVAYRAGESPEELWARAERALDEDRVRRRRTCFRCGLAVLDASADRSTGCPGCGAALERRRRLRARASPHARICPDPSWTPWTAGPEAA
jgi:diguanylate cyclase (GGDEF)-like protein